jgi:hypothetical protein
VDRGILFEYHLNQNLSDLSYYINTSLGTIVYCLGTLLEMLVLFADGEVCLLDIFDLEIE